MFLYFENYKFTFWEDEDDVLEEDVWKNDDDGDCDYYDEKYDHYDDPKDEVRHPAVFAIGVVL